MLTKSIIQKIIIFTLASITSTNILATQIKCPTAEFIKNNFSKKLNRVTRVDINKFVVTYWSVITDEYNNYWAIEVFVDTASSYDFNSAFKLARDELNHVIDRPEEAYLEADRSYCIYVDKNGNNPNTLVFLSSAEKVSEFKRKDFSHI